MFCLYFVGEETKCDVLINIPHKYIEDSVHGRIRVTGKCILFV